MTAVPEVKILVATHKACPLPEGDIYYPIQVGAEGSSIDLGIAKDNEGDNISSRNLCFGTQTALYWGWKNLSCDYLGLAHYRRYLLSARQRKGADIFAGILTMQDALGMLEHHRVLLPKKRHYYVETVESHYRHTMNGGAEQLTHARDIVRECTPDYLGAFETVMRQRSAYIFNMMVMERELVDDYCSWLFPVLFELEHRVDTTGMSDFDKRYMGRVSERLLNVWLERKKQVGELRDTDVLELPYTEDVNWPQKVHAFAKAKLLHEKYQRSF